jgi:hypothetical protein
MSEYEGFLTSRPGLDSLKAGDDMSYIMLKNEKGRYELFDKRTEKFVGILIAPFPPFETGNAFSREFGPIHDKKEIINLSDFPELASLEFFAIEYGG